MHATYSKYRFWIQAAGALVLLFLSACGPSKATPTVSVDAIYTAAYSTMQAQQATQLALTPPTSTPTQTLVPTLAPPPSPISTIAFTSPTAGGFTGGGGAGACDSSAFVKDVTIPDNTVIEPGKKFTKTWTLLNNGTCTWSTAYSLVLDSGDAIGGATTALPASVGPGSSVDISVPMVAPSSDGTYKGVWRLHNAASQAFGDTPWVIIKVGAGSKVTPGPSPTGGPTATTACAGGVCTITITSNKSGFNVDISNAKKGYTDCVVPSGANSCTFNVPVHWDGTVTVTKGSYVFTPSSFTFTNVTAPVTRDFQGQ